MPKQIPAETQPAAKIAPAQLATPPAPAPVNPRQSRVSPETAQPDAGTGFQPKVYQPQDIACCHQNDDLTNCGAEQGEPCRWQESGMEGTYHAERIADAASASQREGSKPSREQFDQAVLDSGLF